MFEYNHNPKTHELFVNLPLEIHFDYDFHNDITELLNRCIENKQNIDTIYVSCKETASYDKMSKGYLLNILYYLNTLVGTVKWNSALSRKITSTVERQDGEKFKKIEIFQEVQKNTQSYYVFHGDKNVQKPVDEITRLLIEKNITLDEDEIREFLSTTIGEIFSNAINHSHEEEIFFMFDIHYEKGDFYLWVNVIDYGKTIITNVKNYFKQDDKSHASCMNWAIQSGNTTRKGSGGYGLPMLISYIKEVKGILYILSADIIYQLEEKECIRLAKGYFYGTSITFKIKLYNENTIIKYDKENETVTSISLDSI